MAKLRRGIEQAGRYGKIVGVGQVLLVLFLTGVSEEEAMSLQKVEEIEGIKVIIEPVVII